jgi:hypothetical protein
MTDSPRSRFRLPHWGWFLLPTMLLMGLGLVGQSAWMPYYREQRVILEIQSFGGHVAAETGGPQWLQWLVGKDRLKKVKVFERVSIVALDSKEITAVEIAHLSELTNLRFLQINHTQETDAFLLSASPEQAVQELPMRRKLKVVEVLPQLSKLTSLEDLTLRGTGVRDADLCHLNSMTNLKSIFFYETAVTASGVKKLQKALPKCEIGIH